MHPAALFVMQALPIPPIFDMVISFIGAFLGILWVAGCAHALNDQFHENLLVASLGATAVLLYGVMESKLAQPRNVIGTALHILRVHSTGINHLFCLQPPPSATTLLQMCFIALGVACQRQPLCGDMLVCEGSMSMSTV